APARRSRGRARRGLGGAGRFVAVRHGGDGVAVDGPARGVVGSSAAKAGESAMTKKPRATARPASRPSTRRQIQQTMEEASRALAEGRYFDCERLADQALHAAWELQDYESLSRITLPLQEARRQRRLAAA